MTRHLILRAVTWALLAILSTSPARAEVASINFARQFGIAFLPLLIMEEDRLIEKHAAALGERDFRVNWIVLTSGAVANDALLSGQLSFGIGALPAMLLLWDKTRGTSMTVSGVTGVAVMPTTLNTRNPNVQSVRDLTDKDRIALPAIRVSNHALVLQMAAAQAFGAENWARFDPLTVALPQPEAAAQLMGGRGEVNAHFGSPPFSSFELKAPGVRTILRSTDIMGDTSLTVLWTTQRFATANPHIVQAVYGAVHEALDTINRDKTAAADRYLRLSGDKIARDDLLALLADPHIQFSPVPLGVMAFANFMKKTGTLRSVPEAWTGAFLPAAHAMPGN